MSRDFKRDLDLDLDLSRSKVKHPESLGGEERVRHPELITFNLHFGLDMSRACHVTLTLILTLTLTLTLTCQFCLKVHFYV